MGAAGSGRQPNERYAASGEQPLLPARSGRYGLVRSWVRMFTSLPNGSRTEEAAETPRLARRAVLDGNLRLLHFGKRCVQIVDLDR
jgi:hypothetical protein